MAHVVLLDLDRTVCRFPATSRLYRRLVLRGGGPAPLAWGALMLFLMHGLWFFAPAVRLQRRIVMSLLARVERARLETAVATLTDEVVADWEVGLGPTLAPLLEAAEAVYLVSHCPQPLGDAVARRLGFAEARAVPVRDYLAGAPGDVYDKADALAELRARHPGAVVHAYADDLVDLPLLRAADHGTLVNGSTWSRLVCRGVFRRVRVAP